MLSISILFDTLFVQGQLAVIRDPDGFTNVRAGKSTAVKVVGKFFDGFVLKIVGRRPTGTDGELPCQKLTGFRMTIGGVPIDIPDADWNDLDEPGLKSCNLFFDEGTGFLYVYIRDNSDGAEGYSVAWIFSKGRYIKRYVDAF